MVNLFTKRITIIFLTIILSFGSASCNGGKSAVDTTWSLVKLVSIGDPIENSATEIVEVKNCGLPVEKTTDCSAGTSNDLSVSLNIGGALGTGSQFIIEGNVGTTLGIGQESGQSAKLPNPPDGFIYIYTVNKSYQVVTGQVLARSSNGEEQVANFSFHASCSIDIVSRELSSCSGNNPIIPPTQMPTSPIMPTAIPATPVIQGDNPFREHKTTPTVGTGVLAQGTYSDGMYPVTESDVSNHLNIQRIRPQENPDGCGIAFLSADKIWFSSGVRTTLTINDSAIGTINGATGKHGYVFDVRVNSGDKVCVTYFEPSGYQIIFGPDMYYLYDSYCYRGFC